MQVAGCPSHVYLQRGLQKGHQTALLQQCAQESGKLLALQRSNPALLSVLKKAMVWEMQAPPRILAGVPKL